MHILEVFRLPFHFGCLDHLQIQHEEKGFMVSASSNMAVLASIWGACFFFLVTFKLPFHALPLLSPHPASFRSFTPGGLKFFMIQQPWVPPSPSIQHLPNRSLESTTRNDIHITGVGVAWQLMPWSSYMGTWHCREDPSLPTCGLQTHGKMIGQQGCVAEMTGGDANLGLF